MAQKRETYLVTLTRPKGVTPRRLKAYIKEAVSLWCQQLEPPGASYADSPGDPLFMLRGRISVKTVAGK